MRAAVRNFCAVLSWTVVLVTCFHASAFAGPLAVSAITPSPVAPVAGSTVTWSASVSGGTGTVLYRFWLYNEGTQTWALLQDYSASATVPWTASAGTYHTQVWVKDAASTAAFDAWQNSASVAVASASAPTRLTSVSMSQLSATARTPLTIAAAASGGSNAYEYRFYLYDAWRQHWTLLQDYSAASSVSWTPDQAGDYWAQVWVRTAGSQAVYEDWQNGPIVSVSPAVWTLTAARVSSASGQTGQPITWSAETNNTTDTILYRFWLRNATAGTWQILQDYSTSPWVTFSPHTSGQYYVQVWARTSTSTSGWDSWLNGDAVDISGASTADAPPAWTVVRTVAGRHVVSWDPVPGVDGYVVLESTDRDTLVGSPSTSGGTSVVAPPYTAPGTPGNTPHYFRVFPVVHGVVADGGPVAASTAVTGHLIDTPPLLLGSGTAGEEFAEDVTAALWDIDGDGCLDMIGRRGNCDGTFTASDLDPLGAGLLFEPGRVNRDSRFADFTGDGIVDIFTNVYSPATMTASHAILLVGQPDGTFREDPGVTALGIGGFGETVIAADFDNDGDIDIYLPHYFEMGDGAHSWLLINDGHGVFHDAAASAGVASTQPFNPEGAQALDFNQDGWVDLLVATHLYINNGDLTFTDVSAAVNLPAVFDEGTLLFDADLDGDLDLVHHDAIVTRLYRNVNGRFDSGTVLTGAAGQNFGFGLNVCDVNGDGYQDLLVARNDVSTLTGAPQLLLNAGGNFAPSDLSTLQSDYVDLIACADLDNSGLPDIVARSVIGTDHFQSLVNNASSPDTLRITVLGANGERNQQGRAVRVTPLSAPSRTMLRFVESGSAYMAQNGYDLLVATPWTGDYEVSVLFGGGWFTTTAHSGDQLTIYEDGTVVVGLR